MCQPVFTGRKDDWRIVCLLSDCVTVGTAAIAGENGGFNQLHFVLIFQKFLSCFINLENLFTKDLGLGIPHYFAANKYRLNSSANLQHKNWLSDARNRSNLIHRQECNCNTSWTMAPHTRHLVISLTAPRNAGCEQNTENFPSCFARGYGRAIWQHRYVSRVEKLWREKEFGWAIWQHRRNVCLRLRGSHVTSA